jgi:hypothetical protein
LQAGWKGDSEQGVAAEAILMCKMVDREDLEKPKTADDEYAR